MNSKLYQSIIGDKLKNKYGNKNLNWPLLFKLRKLFKEEFIIEIAEMLPEIEIERPDVYLFAICKIKAEQDNYKPKDPVKAKELIDSIAQLSKKCSF